jgi:hypothetical protein
VTIDESISWTYQIKYLESQLAKITGVISRLKYFIPSGVLKLLYDSLFASKVQYCLMIWGSTYSTKLNKIYLLQKKNDKNNY